MHIKPDQTTEDLKAVVVLSAWYICFPSAHDQSTSAADTSSVFAADTTR